MFLPENTRNKAEILPPFLMRKSNAGDGGGSVRQKRSFCRVECRTCRCDVVEKENVLATDFCGMHGAEGAVHVFEALTSGEFRLRSRVACAHERTHFDGNFR